MWLLRGVFADKCTMYELSNVVSLPWLCTIYKILDEQEAYEAREKQRLKHR